MNKLFLFLFLIPAYSHAQSFHPSPGDPNSNAIKKDSSCFVSWATGGTITRGYINISDTTAEASGTNRASFGNLNLALGPATGSTVDVVSLGDSGVATLSFDQFIMDGPGYDFAVFENGFTDNYIELAHVEVSSDGVHFFRFPSTTEVPLDSQLGNASFSDCRMVNNLAGKYRVGYGTPFDLSELPNDPNLDKNAVQYVRIIDAIGAISGSHYTTDQYGTIINDPFPTPFESGGFDLEAIGVINGTLGLKEQQLLNVSAYPNPAKETIRIDLQGPAVLRLYTADGRLLETYSHLDQSTISLQDIAPGMYNMLISQGEKTHVVSVMRVY
ncbi:T9SS type A sorting domain-containing protein [Fluviicola sp.]|uniref:T9SS type A sorting domain-containing protein n=1 Tax=Fluviicola sp. TaxID=1917219 RepID=UPI0031D5D8FB